MLNYEVLRKNQIQIIGDFTEFYNENDDVLECPYLKIENATLLDINNDSIVLETNECTKITEYDGVGNVEQYIVLIPRWSQDALLNRSIMLCELGHIDDDSRIVADFMPDYIYFDTMSNNVRDIKAVGQYKMVIDHEKEVEAYGELEIELNDWIEFDELQYIDNYTNLVWANFIIDDPKVLEVIEKEL